MGKIGQGILGGISGKAGNVVGGTWKGIDYLRIKPTNVANPRTEGQVNQRTKFTLALEFLQPNKEIIKVGYKAFATKKSEFNAAMSYILNNAIEGTAPNFTIDYSEALLSRGSLSTALNPSMDLSNAGQVDFTWTDNSEETNADATDKSIMIVYNPSKKESKIVSDVSNRSKGSGTVFLPNSYAGDTIEMFMTFVSEDGIDVANSVYLGSGVAS